MLLDHKLLKTFVKSFDRSQIVYIHTNRNVYSICSLYVLTIILKKELIKFQIDFRRMESSLNLVLTTSEDLLMSSSFSYEELAESEVAWVLSNDVDHYCTCYNRETVGIAILFRLIKSMDFVRIETVWPVCVAFSFYKKFLTQLNYKHDADSIPDRSQVDLKTGTKDDATSRIGKNQNINKENLANKSNRTENFDEDSCCVEDSLCPSCTELSGDLEVSIKMLNCKFEGVFCRKQISLEFLSCASLMQSLKNDIQFVHDKKLFYNKSNSANMKIGEYLAKRGISLQAASDPFESIGIFSRKLIEGAVGTKDKFIYKNGHDLEISAVEHAFLILFYLYKDMPMYAYMGLCKRKLIDVDKASKFYEKIITTFKEGVVSASKLDDLIVFKIRKGMLSNFEIVADFYSDLFKVYLRFRNERFYKILINYHTEDDHCVLYSRDANLDITGVEKEHESFIKVKSSELPSILKQIAKLSK